MNDPAIYLNFINNVCQVNTPCVVNEVLSFADTFLALLSTNEKEFDNFVKNTHASNSATANNAKILILSVAINSVKAVLFELKDCERCNALPNQIMLNAINAAQIVTMRSNRTQAIEEIKQDSLAGPPTSDVPKLTAKTYDSFIRAFTNKASNMMVVNGTTLDYLMRANNGNYDAAGWTSRRNVSRHVQPS